jgi:pyrroline-5-carboxylate reductase
MQDRNRLAIIGAGNIGTAIANGLLDSGIYRPEDLILTRKKTELLASFADRGCNIVQDNLEAIASAEIVLIAVEPQQFDALMAEISGSFRDGKKMIISVVSGVSIGQIKDMVNDRTPVIRAMPNTAIAVRESMTCITARESDQPALESARKIFDTVGISLEIREEQMTAATALGACGIAFFLRAIRAASQGGIEIGFHAQDALKIAAQTAKGASVLLQKMRKHPEFEVDNVTTPRGCTISGLNQLEHEGFSSAMIKGIVVSAEKAAKLYQNE